MQTLLEYTQLPADAVTKARDLAILLHADQEYGAGVPYVAHLDEVAASASRYWHPNLGFDLVRAMVVAYLHDAIEDCKSMPRSNLEELIERTFNRDVLDDVLGVTDAIGKNRKERKRLTWHKIRSSQVSTFIKLNDRLCNTRGTFVDMYRKEFPLFEAALYVPGTFEDLWHDLSLATYA